MKKNTFITKEDTKKFKKASRKLIVHYLKSAIISLTKFDFYNSKRSVVKGVSFFKNMHCSKYPKTTGKKVAVYTALFGDYDNIKPIKVKNPNCDYYIYTDQKVDDNLGWTLKKIDFPTDVKWDNVLKNRYLKMHPHILFPEYEYSIYIDAVFGVDLDIYRLMGRMGEHLLGLFKHHRGTNCLYEEAEILVASKIAPKEQTLKQMEKYKNEGFPINYGFFECSCIIRKHMHKKCIDAMETWWTEFLNGAKRDQLSFMYSLWKNGLSKDDVASLGCVCWFEPILSNEDHKK